MAAIFTAKFNLTTSTGSGPYAVTGNVISNASANFDATDVAIGDIVYLEFSSISGATGDIGRYRVTAITSAVGTALACQLTWAQTGTALNPADVSGTVGIIGRGSASFKLMAIPDSSVDSFPARLMRYAQNVEGHQVLDPNLGSGARTVFISPTGLDTNSGTIYTAPVKTPAKVLELLGENGSIVMLPGNYDDPDNPITFDLTNTVDVSIRAWQGAAVRVFLGEKKSGVSAFTQHLSTTIYKCAITDAIATDVSHPHTRNWLFQTGTPEGAITAALSRALQKQRAGDGTTAYRLPHFRLKRVVTGTHGGDNPDAELAALVADTGLQGYYVYRLDSGVPTVYFRRTDSANPNSIGSGIWIPSKDTSRTFVTGGNGRNHVSVQGVEVYFAYIGFEYDSFASARSEGCFAFGCKQAGTAANYVNFVEEINCEYAATGSDGIDSSGATVTESAGHSSKMILHGGWAHDNGDQGASGHQGSEMLISGGLYESNGNGGILGFGRTLCLGVSTRNNTTCGFSVLHSSSNGAISDTMECIDCHSEGDVNGYFPSAQGSTGGRAKIIVRGGSVRNASTAAFNAQANTVIQHSGVLLNGNALTSTGDGTVTATDHYHEPASWFTAPPNSGAGPINSRIRGMTVADSFRSAGLFWGSPVNAPGEYTALMDLLAILTSDNTGATAHYTQLKSYGTQHTMACGTSVYGMDASGAGYFQGTFKITGNSLFTDSTTFNLVNATATTINFGGAASVALNIGHASGGATFAGPPRVPTYTVAGVPSAATFARGIIYVSNEAGGATIAFSDGTNWRRVADLAVIS